MFYHDRTIVELGLGYAIWRDYPQARRRFSGPVSLRGLSAYWLIVVGAEGIRNCGRYSDGINTYLLRTPPQSKQTPISGFTPVQTGGPKY